jgi:spore germination protein KC
MRFSKKMRLLIAILLLSLLLSGCWDRTETNDLAFVLTSAVDLEEDGKYRVSYLLPLPGQMGGASGGGGGTGGAQSYYIDSEIGKTLRDATYQLQKRIPRKLFLSHRRTVVVGEEVAKKGITQLFDDVPRLPESRLSTYLIVTKGKGYELLNTKPKFERFPAEAIRELARPPQTMPLSTKDVGIALSFHSDPIMAYLEKRKSEKGKEPTNEVEIVGYGQFLNDRMVGIYKEEAAIGLLWLKNKQMKHMETFPIQDDKNMTILVTSGTGEIRPELHNEQVTFHVRINVTGKVREDSSEQDLNQSAVIHLVEDKFAEHAKQTVEAAIKQMQREGTDSAQLGLLVWRKYPYAWKHGLETNWRDTFKKANFQIEAEASITETGLINQNVLKGAPRE